MDRRDEPNLADRRAFLKKAATSAGVAFTVPAILSTVRPTDLAARVSGGGRPPGAGPPFENPGGGPPPGVGGGPPPGVGGPGRGR